MVLEGERHELTTPLTLEVTHEGNCWTCYHKSLSLCGFGPRLDDAVEDARQCLANRWLDAVSQDDVSLTARGLAAKIFLLELLPSTQQPTN
jgi:hypothetical protein